MHGRDAPARPARGDRGEALDGEQLDPDVVDAARHPDKVSHRRQLARVAGS